MKQIIKITESQLRETITEVINETISKFRNGNNGKYIYEVKYFHPSGRKTLPNGSHYQKGGFIKECIDNLNSFVLSEDIHGEQYGMSDYRGGVIVFSTDVNAVKLHNNRFVNFIKQFVKTQSQRFNKDKKVHNIINKFNRETDTNDYVGAYSFGNFFKGKYVGDNGEMFNDKSLALEINGLSSKGLLRLAEYISKDFLQETVLVKDLNQNKIYLVNSNPFQGTEQDLIDKLNKNINKKSV